jgi:hypothetical protein
MPKALSLSTRAKAAHFRSPAALWSGPQPPHTLENVDTFEIRVISVELK